MASMTHHYVLLLIVDRKASREGTTSRTTHPRNIQHEIDGLPWKHLLNLVVPLLCNISCTSLGMILGSIWDDTKTDQNNFNSSSVCWKSCWVGMWWIWQRLCMLFDRNSNLGRTCDCSDNLKHFIQIFNCLKVGGMLWQVQTDQTTILEMGRISASILDGFRMHVVDHFGCKQRKQVDIKSGLTNGYGFGKLVWKIKISGGAVDRMGTVGGFTGKRCKGKSWACCALVGGKLRRIWWASSPWLQIPGILEIVSWSIDVGWKINLILVLGDHWSVWEDSWEVFGGSLGPLLGLRSSWQSPDNFCQGPG